MPRPPFRSLTAGPARAARSQPRRRGPDWPASAARVGSPGARNGSRESPSIPAASPSPGTGCRWRGRRQDCLRNSTIRASPSGRKAYVGVQKSNKSYDALLASTQQACCLPHQPSGTSGPSNSRTRGSRSASWRTMTAVASADWCRAPAPPGRLLSFPEPPPRLPESTVPRYVPESERTHAGAIHRQPARAAVDRRPQVYPEEQCRNRGQDDATSAQYHQDHRCTPSEACSAWNRSPRSDARNRRQPS